MLLSPVILLSIRRELFLVSYLLSSSRLLKDQIQKSFSNLDLPSSHEIHYLHPRRPRQHRSGHCPAWCQACGTLLLQVRIQVRRLRKVIRRVRSVLHSQICRQRLPLPWWAFGHPRATLTDHCYTQLVQLLQVSIRLLLSKAVLPQGLEKPMLQSRIQARRLRQEIWRVCTNELRSTLPINDFHQLTDITSLLRFSGYDSCKDKFDHCFQKPKCKDNDSDDDSDDDDEKDDD